MYISCSRCKLSPDIYGHLVRKQWWITFGKIPAPQALKRLNTEQTVTGASEVVEDQ